MKDILVNIVLLLILNLKLWQKNEKSIRFGQSNVGLTSRK